MATSLKKTFGLGALFIYGLGDILGAGIYALIGKVASEAGMFVWISFAVALGIALLTALSYSELTGRHPHSGGASYFVDVATGSKIKSFLVGWMLFSVSIVSMATLARAFVGYSSSVGISVSETVLILGFFTVLTLINLKGIRDSSIANMISTTVEVAGLIVVVIAGFYFLSNQSGGEGLRITSGIADATSISPLAILQGAALAFYAFIGFEDLANIAEEVKKPKKHLPIAILGSLVCAGLFYILIGWIATQVLTTEALTQSSQPLVDVVAKSQLGVPLKLFGFVALFAVANTCLLNFITASRLLYGMAEQKNVPAIFGRVHEKTATPYVAILALVPLPIILTFAADLKFLAATTSVLILLVFASSNYSLIKIKKKEPQFDGFRVPAIIPWLALAANFILIFVSNQKSLFAALGFFILGLILYGVLNLKSKNTVLQKQYN